jgi:hypothetical protein
MTTQLLKTAETTASPSPTLGVGDGEANKPLTVSPLVKCGEVLGDVIVRFEKSERIM